MAAKSTTKNKSKQVDPELLERMRERTVKTPAQPQTVTRDAVQTAVRTAPPERPALAARQPAPRESLRRNKAPVPKPPPEPPSVSAGPVDKVIELAYNPTRDAIRSMTIIDRIQGRMFPLLDMVRKGTAYILEIAYYRQDKEAYKEMFERDYPEQPDLVEEFMFRTAQWQKSVGGTNLTRASDIALAEKESQNEEENFGGADKYLQDT